MDNPAITTDQTDPPPTGDGKKHTFIDIGNTGAPSNPVEKSAPPDAPYAGMGKDDLMRFSQTPFWSRLRMGCLVVFWLAWLGLLVAVVVLTIIMPRCTAPPANTWSQHIVIYDVYVPSFFDAKDNDGLGDIKGVTEKLDYLRYLGVKALTLSSIYSSSDPVFNDVLNHTEVDPRLGSLDDVKELVKAAHDKDMKVLLDFIPNHTSKNHSWFIQSEMSSNHTTNPLWNYYIWAACGPGNTQLPNNWVSVYGGEAWEFSAQRGECYFHNFLSDEPELNLRSSGVQEQLADILKYWVAAADVDGFRIRSASFLFEDADLRDDDVIAGCSDMSSYDCLEHTRTRTQEENYVIINAWRRLVDSLPGQRILAVESHDGINQTTTFYGGTSLVGAQLPINIQLTSLTANDDATAVRKVVRDWLASMPSGGTADWASASSEFGRQDRVQSAALLHMLKMTLPGTTFNYYGEELGMRNANYSGCTPVDPAGLIHARHSRDAYRSPMQWDRSVNAGFTNASIPWLPVNDDSIEVNVESQQGSSYSPLSIIKSLIELRDKEGSLQYGDISFLLSSTNIVSYMRQFNGKDSLLVAMNFGTAEETNDFSAINSTIPTEANVVMTTSADVTTRVGDVTSLKSLRLAPGEGIIVKWPYKRQ